MSFLRTRMLLIGLPATVVIIGGVVGIALATTSHHGTGHRAAAGSHRQSDMPTPSPSPSLAVPSGPAASPTSAPIGTPSPSGPQPIARPTPSPTGPEPVPSAAPVPSGEPTPSPSPRQTR
jgi:hypothetical protein